MHVGFIHGVMNTDNMAISGETIDYGPCAFMEAYDPRGGLQLDRHAVGATRTRNQPLIARWNLARLAEALLPLIDPDEPERAIPQATEVLDEFPAKYEVRWLAGAARQARTGAGGGRRRFRWPATGCRYCRHRWSTTRWPGAAWPMQPMARDQRLQTLFADPGPLNDWLARWRSRAALESSTR